MSHGHPHDGQHHHQHDHGPDHSHDHGHGNEKKWHRDWRIWVAAFLMIGLLIYCLATFML
jgi:hypothetical protein